MPCSSHPAERAIAISVYLKEDKTPVKNSALLVMQIKEKVVTQYYAQGPEHV
jgi:hypothetical protein